MRKGFAGLAAQAETILKAGLKADPFSGHLFVFRGRRGDLIKIIWWDGQGACLFSKRLEKGRFVWPSTADGKVMVTATTEVLALRAALADRDGQLAAAEAELKSRDLLIEKRKHQLAGMRRHRFGATSEALDQLQLRL